MKVEQLRNAYYTEPFRPFVIRMVDGRQFDVPRRHLLALSPNGRTAVVFGDGESFFIIEPELVAELDISGREETTNGQKPSR